jgi:phage terminase large subunit GpA-like protein
MINEAVLEDVLESGKYLISTIRPSVWAESKIIMPEPFPGPLRYSETTPYTKEIIDRLSMDDPVREIALMGSAQFGKSKSIIEPGIGYIIENDPGNIIMTVGHEGLIEEAMNGIDYMLDTTELRRLIKPTAQRAKSNKTGDTNTLKQFPGGYFKIASASNPKIWRQANYRYGFIDDFEAVKSNSKIAGDTRDLIEKRFTVYAKTKKILYISSPELAAQSNILKVYNLGDQRKYLVPCPHCKKHISLEWEVPVGDEMAGITWKTDEHGSLITSSVGYVCQICGNFFTDNIKHKIVRDGYWKPTKQAFKPEFTSYYMNSLYSPPFMDDWTHYVYKYMECSPVGAPRIESKYQTFLNLNLGLAYEKSAEAPKANQLQSNIRPYEIGTLPEKLSIQEGNGKIMLLTCACDLNGIVEDARLDYEVVAWAESGASYSIKHGSIGTFIPLEGKNKADREHWTYEHNKEKSVWPEFDKVVDQLFLTDTGRAMKIFITGVDTGHYNYLAYPYVDKSIFNIVALKGDKESKYIKTGLDVASFKVGKERSNLYLIQVNQVKDELAALMKLNYDDRNDAKQPYGFMNYPTPAGELYQFKTFFEHYESEHRVTESVDGEITVWTWKKKSNVHQNHFWDCRVYNMALKDISVMLLCKDAKMKKYTWQDFVALINSLSA